MDPVFEDDTNERLYALMIKDRVKLDFPNHTLFISGEPYYSSFLKFKVTGDSEQITIENGSGGARESRVYNTRDRCLLDNDCLDFYSGQDVYSNERDLDQALSKCATSREKPECRALYANIEPFLNDKLQDGDTSGCGSRPCDQPECFSRDRDKLSLSTLRKMATCTITRSRFYIDNTDIDSSSALELVGDEGESVPLIDSPFMPVNMSGVLFCGCALLALLLVRSII